MKQGPQYRARGPCFMSGATADYPLSAGVQADWSSGPGRRTYQAPQAGRREDVPSADHNTDEYTQLRNKLSDKADAFLNSNDPHDLADILDLLHALAHNLGVSPAELEKLRADKATERGGFTQRIVWSGNTPPG